MDKPEKKVLKKIKNTQQTQSISTSQSQGEEISEADLKRIAGGQPCGGGIRR